MKPAEQHRSTERVLDILELVAQDGRPHYTLTQISQRLDAPKSSLLPILRTLHQRGYLFFEESHLFHRLQGLRDRDRLHPQR